MRRRRGCVGVRPGGRSGRSGGEGRLEAVDEADRRAAATTAARARTSRRGRGPRAPRRRAGRRLDVGAGHPTGQHGEHRRSLAVETAIACAIASSIGSAGAAVEDRPDAGQLVGGRAPGVDDRGSRSSGWPISSRSMRPARRVCQRSWRAPSSVELVAEGLGDAGDVHRQDAVAADVGRRRSRCGGLPRGGGRTSQVMGSSSLVTYTYRWYVLTVCNHTAVCQTPAL